MCRLRERERALIAGLILLDQLFKYFTLKSGSAFVNNGISFGISFDCCLVPLLAIFLALVGFFYFKYKQRTFLFLILVGGGSNLLDRILYGGVVDYIRLFALPVFNLADVIVVGGAFWFVVDFFFGKKI